MLEEFRLANSRELSVALDMSIACLTGVVENDIFACIGFAAVFLIAVLRAVRGGFERGADEEDTY